MINFLMRLDSQPASCINTIGGCFCENHPVYLTTQPANILSSIAFIALAMLIIYKFRTGFLTWIYSIALILVGLGTAYYHMKLTFLGQTFDFGGMNALILIAPFTYFAYNRKKNILILVWVSYFLLLLFSIIQLIYWPNLRRQIFAIIVALIIALCFIDYRKILSKLNKRYFAYSLVIFVISYIFWNIDTYRIFCYPFSWLQGHAVWHLMNAVAAYYLFLSMKYNDLTTNR